MNHMDPGEVIVDATKSVLMASLFLCSANAFAQSVDKEPAAILEIGAAPNRSLKGGGSSFGPTVAVEVTPIENWLELEAGVTPLFARHSTEWDADLLFKKPWTLSRKGGIYVRRRSRVDSYQPLQRGNKLSGRRGRAGFYVLAFAKA